MVKRKGLLAVFEGIDGAGTSTQVHKIAEEIEHLNKYQDVVRTHEPWESNEIKLKLKKEKDPFFGAEEIANLFVDDRAKHTRELIRPNLKAGAIVLCDRYSMSTCTYQWAQGMQIEELMLMHKDRGILIPDITFFIDVEGEVANRRIETRAVIGSTTEKEKFENNHEYTKKLINAYRAAYHLANVNPSIFGRVEKIDGNKDAKEVTAEIINKFKPIYGEWSLGNYFQSINPNL